MAGSHLRYSLPLVWRHLGKVPCAALLWMIRDMDMKQIISKPFRLLPDPPPEVPDWTTYTPQKQEEVFNTYYGRDWLIPEDLGSPEYLQDWKERSYAMMNEMKAICDQHGMRLIFFASPLASNDPYRANPVLSQRLSDMVEHIRSMGLEYYDFRTACPDTKFRDGGHLLRSSSYEFTRMFYREILQLPFEKGMRE